MRSIVTVPRKVDLSPGLKNIIKDFSFMIKRDLGMYWKFCWMLFIPVTLLAIFLHNMIHPVIPTVSGVPLPEVAYGNNDSNTR